MPQIPKLGTQNINVNAVDLAQGPSITKAGVEAEAWQQLGSTVANIGEMLMQKRKQSDTSSFLNTRKNELNRLVAGKETELKAKYSGDPTGYADEMDSFLKEYNDSQKELAPNDDAKRMWDQDFNDYFTQVSLQAKSTENRNKSIYQSSLISEDAFKNRQVIANKPDPALTLDFMSNSFKAINDGTGLYHNEAEASKMKETLGKQYTQTLMESFDSQKKYGQGLRFLAGSDEESKAVLQYADPKDIMAYRERFSRQAQQENEFSKRVFNTGVNDLQAALMQGENVPEDVFSNFMTQANSLKPEEKSFVIDDLNQAKEYNRVLKDIKSMPVEEIRKKAAFEIPRKEGDIFNLSSRQKMAAMYQKAAMSILNDKANDGAAFIIKNDQKMENLSNQALNIGDTASIKEYATSIVEKQKVEGITNVKLLNKTMSKNYGAYFTSPNPEVAENAMKALSAGYGKHFGNVVNEMVKNESITPTHAMAMYLSDETSRKQSFANISKKKEIDEAFKKVSTGRSEISNVFNDEDIQDLKQAILINDPTNQRLWLNNGLDDLVELEYKNQRVNGISEKDSKKNAISKVIKGNFAVAKDNNSNVILSKNYISKKSEIEDWMGESFNDINIRNFKYKVPDSYIKDMGLLGKPEEANTKYIEDLQKNGAWISNNSQTGAILRKKTKSGKLATVFDDKGEMIQVSFDDMLKSPVKRFSRKEGF